MSGEFSLGMGAKLKVKNGYLVAGKSGDVVRMSDIKSFNITKEGLVLNGSETKLTTIKGLNEKKAFAAIDFINNEKDKLKAGQTAKSKSMDAYHKFLLMMFLVIVLAVIVIAGYFFMTTP